MRVLYVNHTGQVSGGERSLLDLLGALEPECHGELASPPGPLAALASAAGITVHPIAETTGSLRLHLRHTPRAALQMAHAAWQVARLVRRLKVDVVHANTLRSGLVAVLAVPLGAPRPVVHVRDVLPDGRATRAVYAVLDRGAAALVANSAHTARALPPLTRAPVHVVHNPVDLERFDPRRHDRVMAREAIGLDDGDIAAAVIAQLTPWKAQDDAVRAVAVALQEVPTLRLLLIGSAKFVDKATRFDNRAFVAGLEALIAELGLADDRVMLLGERGDIPNLLSALDLVLVPSWEEPFGRTVVEALAMGVPVLATEVGGPSEIIDDGVQGYLLPPREPATWGASIARVAADPGLRDRLGAAGRSRAEAFSAARHFEQLVDIYSVRGKKTEPGRSRRASR